jgi:hypothetical protein
MNTALPVEVTIVWTCWLGVGFANVPVDEQPNWTFWGIFTNTNRAFLDIWRRTERITRSDTGMAIPLAITGTNRLPRGDTVAISKLSVVWTFGDA